MLLSVVLEGSVEEDDGSSEEEVEPSSDVEPSVEVDLSVEVELSVGEEVGSTVLVDVGSGGTTPLCSSTFKDRNKLLTRCGDRGQAQGSHYYARPPGKSYSSRSDCPPRRFSASRDERKWGCAKK